jgi:plasmid rolling circle replication initiator protein Rep
MYKIITTYAQDVKQKETFQFSAAEKELIDHKTPVKRLSVKIANKFADGGEHEKADKICYCCGGLFLSTYDFPEEIAGGGLKTKYESYHCHVRLCPNCIKRREQRMRAIAYQALEELIQDHPDIRFVFLGLTVPNCDIWDLRTTLKIMSKAWNKFIKYKPIAKVVRGFARSVEVTPGDEKNPDGSPRLDRAHPHYHVLLAVDDGYFTGRNYLKREKWLKHWQKATCNPAITQVDVRTIYNRETKKKIDYDNSPEVIDAVREIMKYEIKFESIEEQDAGYIITMADQLHNMRFAAYGGLIKDYMNKYRKIKYSLGMKEILEVLPDYKEKIEEYKVEESFAEWTEDEYIKTKSDESDEDIDYDPLLRPMP